MDVVPGLVETAREHVALMIGLVFVAAALEAMLGFGVVIPGETALVLVGASLGMEPMLEPAALSWGTTSASWWGVQSVRVWVGRGWCVEWGRTSGIGRAL